MCPSLLDKRAVHGVYVYMTLCAVGLISVIGVRLLDACKHSRCVSDTGFLMTKMTVVIKLRSISGSPSDAKINRPLMN